MNLNRPLSKLQHARVVIVGGGIAGITAALELTALGLPVTLVEAQAAIGGLMARLDKTFPTNDCATCILSPRLLALSRQPQLELLTLSRVVDVRGQVGDFRVVIRQQPRYVRVDRCSGCGDCQRVCPVTIPDPHNQGLSNTKAIRLPYPQAVPLAAVIDPQACRLFRGKKCQACVKVCLAAAIDFDQQPRDLVIAAGVIILAPGATPASPRLAGVPAPNVVTSLEFERLLSATGPYGGRLARPADGQPPRRLAFIQCVGSRDPAGGAPYCSTVCCPISLKQAMVAKELAPEPVDATIFYMDLRLGGKGLERYLEAARRHGVQLIRSRVTRLEPQPDGSVRVHYTNASGRHCQAGFDLVVLATGLRPQALSLEGLPDLAGPYGFLQALPWQLASTPYPGILLAGTAREPQDISDSVVSAGAAAAVAAQLLAVAERPLPRIPPVPAPTAAEPLRLGIFLCHCGTNIAGVLDLQELARQAVGLPGVVQVEERLFACAPEATAQLAEIIRARNLNRVIIAACSPRTHEPVFREVLRQAGLNPGYLLMVNLREQCAWVHQRERQAAQLKAAELLRMAVLQARELQPLRPIRVPVQPTALILGGGVAGMTAAITLADQGFHCYLVEKEAQLGGLATRLYFSLTGADPQALVHELQVVVRRHPNITIYTRSALARLGGHSGNFLAVIRRQPPAWPREIQLNVGAVIVATGGREYRPVNRYLYGADPRVLTQLELEERLATDTLELEPAPEIIMIQCVGSREPDHPYCSRLCCREAIKNAILLQKRWPAARITILYRDIRTPGLWEDYYLQAKELGIRFLPYEADQPPQVEAGLRGPLVVKWLDALLGEHLTQPADLLVLSAGIEPATASRDLDQLLGLARGPEGFYLEAHQKLRPVEVMTEGVFLCGLAHSPRDLAETVAQAQAAAAKAAQLLRQPALAAGEVTAQLDPGRCARCLTCVAICPAAALKLGPGGRPVVQLTACQGCGLCAARCPAGAISLSRLSDAELAAALLGLRERPAKEKTS